MIRYQICETCEKYESKLDFLRAEIEVLRGVGCRGEKADEPESGPCGVCLLCAEERGAKLAIDAVRSGDFDVFRGEAWATAEAICARDRGKR
jgi:hypothetical protein